MDWLSINENKESLILVPVVLVDEEGIVRADVPFSKKGNIE
jgi:hypothetical protein